MTAEVVVTGPSDIRDQRWLDERIATARNGIEAVIDVALNWTAGRNVSRLHPGVAPADYVREHVGLLGRDAIVPLLTETNWSNRQIAAVAGVSPQTVSNQLSKSGQLRPIETFGADGKMRPSSPFRPRLDPMPYGRSAPPPVVEERPTPFRLVAQTFERDARRLLDAYRTHLDDERFSARFGAVLAAIEKALQEGK